MKTFLTNWTLFRFIRLMLGVYILVDGLMNGLWFFAFFGLILTCLPLFNLGCCANGNCNTANIQNGNAEDEELIYEEIKLKKD